MVEGADRGPGQAPEVPLTLAARYRLSPRQLVQLESVLESIASDARAPTSARAASHALDVHVADSLVAVELEVVAGATRIVDLGAGAGLPGLVLAVALPSARLVLLDSNSRKCAFMADVIARAGVENARAVWARAESWTDGAGAGDVVTARALAPQAVVLEYAAPLLRLGGSLVDWRGSRDAQGEARAQRAAAELGMERRDVLRVDPYEGARDHHLHVFTKISETPPRFPRRVGMARKRPLG